jgi:pimeloyl-ACP methyl ester carboxylesterase
MKFMRVWWTGRQCSAIIAAALAAGCVQRVPPAVPGAPVEFDRALALNGHQLILHLARPAGTGVRRLLMYATGDGGWRGKDLDTYRKLVSWNYPTVGFSSPDYLNHLPHGSETTTPTRLARDFGAIIHFAKASLMLSAETPVILVGVSRGAGLAVVAAGQGALRGELGGVVAVALTKEEEHVRRLRRILGNPAQSRARTPVMIETYEYLPLLGAEPVSVIQSTHDSYLPADAARVLFGPDTERRQFHAIEARDHSFGDARAAMYDAIHASLVWIDGLIPDAGRHR